MKIMVTGAGGFIAKNLITELENRGCGELFLVTPATSEETFYNYCRDAQFVFHLAGSNRPQDEADLIAVNYGFTRKLLTNLREHGNSSPVVFASSAQAALDNPYGRSKKAGEELCFEHAEKTDAKVMVYRFSNVFGKWARPNYNSAVVTFCHNLARDLPIVVNDRLTVMTLVYVGDLVEELFLALKGRGTIENGFYRVPLEYRVTLGQVVDLIESFKSGRIDLTLPALDDPFVKKLYSTYISCLPPESFSYPLQVKADQRGSFSELFRTEDRGQFSVSVSRPGAVRGNHWHQHKHEKFIVVSGKGRISFRIIGSEEVFAHDVNGEKPVVVDIPPGYTHKIENSGSEKLVTLIWVNEPYDPNDPDTYHLEV